MKRDEFFIGWEEDLPNGYGRFLMMFLAGLSAVILVLTVIWVLKSDNFVDSRFDYGNQTIHKGIIYEYPAPMLVVMNTEDTLTYPLVNFGKSGPVAPIKFFKSQMRNNLLNYEVELQGTLIEFDGKTWLELTEEDRSLLSFDKLESTSPPLEITSLGRQTLTGEIVDPKCFFGVMKPGFGKVHLSCAVRCIAGGVPPILVSPQEDGAREYYFVTGRGGKPINQELLTFIGYPVSVSGAVKNLEGWNVVEIDSDNIEVASIPGELSIFNVCITEEDQRLTDLIE